MDTPGGTVYRASAQPYIVFGSIFAFMLAIMLYGPARWYDLLPVLAGTAFIFIWLHGFAICILPEELEFQTLFGGKRSIRINQIHSIELSFAHATWWQSRNSGALQLIIKPRDAEIQDIHINAKVFSPAAVRAVMDLEKRGIEVHGQDLQDGIAMKYLRDWRKRFKSRNH